jgi:hypothetical protein
MTTTMMTIIINYLCRIILSRTNLSVISTETSQRSSNQEMEPS